MDQFEAFAIDLRLAQRILSASEHHILFAREQDHCPLSVIHECEHLIHVSRSWIETLTHTPTTGVVVVHAEEFTGVQRYVIRVATAG